MENHVLFFFLLLHNCFPILPYIESQENAFLQELYAKMYPAFYNLMKFDNCP